MFVKVKHIKRLHRQAPCYDLQVAEVERYYTNNILSHNSEIICAAVKALQPALTLILVNRIFLAQQIKQRLRMRGFADSDVGIIYGTEKDYDQKPIIVSTIQSIVGYPDIYKNAEMLVVDETKHVQAKTFQEIIRRSKAKVRVGFDATPFTMSDKITDWNIRKYIGDVIYEVTTKELIDKKILVRPIIRIIKIENDIKKDSTFQTIYNKYITNNTLRNNIIKKIADRYDGKVLILVSYINHGRLLHKAISNSTFLWGEIDSQERFDEVQNFIGTKDRYVMIGSNIFSEGVDFSTGVDAIIIASADKGFRTVVQKLGRALRKNAKGYVDVWDFWDTGHKFLYERSESRTKIYREEGHEICFA